MNKPVCSTNGSFKMAYEGKVFYFNPSSWLSMWLVCLFICSFSYFAPLSVFSTIWTLDLLCFAVSAGWGVMKAAVSRHKATLIKRKTFIVLHKGTSTKLLTLYLHTLAVCRERKQFVRPLCHPANTHYTTSFWSSQTVLLDSSFFLIIFLLPLQSHSRCHSFGYIMTPNAF